MDLLSELGKKYGTDKIGKHNYLPIYYDLFKDRRNEVKKVLEIGPAEGAGLFMFRDFFPNAAIYGAEIDPERVNKLQGLDRIEVYQCDQSNYEDLMSLIEKTGGDIDLVIDDGSHKPTDQIFTCESLMRKLYFGATYIIEDVADENIVRELNKFYPEVKKVGKRYDDRLVIMKIDE